MKRLISVLSMLMAIIGNVNAGPYPVVSSISTRILSASAADYYVSFAVIDVPAADQPAPANASFSLAHRHDAFPGGEDIVVPNVFNFGAATCAYGECSGGTRPGETMSQAAMRITKNGKALKSLVVGHSGQGNGNECVGYVFLTAPYGPIPWSGAILPGNTCVYAPPGNSFCEIETPTLTLDHGNLTLGNANGSEASKKVEIHCSIATTVTLRLASDINYIPLQNNARANIMINDKPVGGRFNFPASYSEIEIKSVLDGVSMEGDYSGTSVLIIEPA